MTLRELREQKKLTQEEVALRGELEQTTVSQLETGKIQDPRHSTLTKLATVYKVKVDVVAEALAESVRQSRAA